jgi:hypothetical protein
MTDTTYSEKGQDKASREMIGTEPT